MPERTYRVVWGGQSGWSDDEDDQELGGLLENTTATMCLQVVCGLQRYIKSFGARETCAFVSMTAAHEGLRARALS